MTSSGTVQSLDRAIDLLEALAQVGGSASLSELASASGLPLPTIHRLMRTLLLRGYALQQPSRRYALGPRFIRIGEIAGRQFGANARAHLERLAESLGESINLAMIDRDMVLYTAQAASSRSMRMFTEVGRRVHCHSTGVGKAILAQLPDAAVREIVARVGMPAATERTITTLNDLMTEIEKIRAAGYAVDDGEQEIGVRCFAVVVPDAPTATALSVSGPETRVTEEFGQAAVPSLKEAARRISDELNRAVSS